MRERERAREKERETGRQSKREIEEREKERARVRARASVCVRERERKREREREREREEIVKIRPMRAYSKARSGLKGAVQSRWRCEEYRGTSLKRNLPPLRMELAHQNGASAERSGAIWFFGWTVMTSVVNLVTKSGFITFFVNFRFWIQLLVIVTVTRGHDGFPGEFRGKPILTIFSPMALRNRHLPTVGNSVAKPTLKIH